MGFLKIKQPVLESGRAIAPIQTLTAASTGTTVNHYGVTILSSSASKTYRLANPVRAGEVKEVIFRSKATAAKITLQPLTTAQTFWNSTKGTITSSSVQHQQPPAVARLLAVASTGTYALSWTLISKTTALTVAG